MPVWGKSQSNKSKNFIGSTWWTVWIFIRAQSFLCLCIIRIPPLVCCLEASLPWLTVWKKGIWDNISVIIHGKLGVWNKATWLFYLENCCLAHCDWKNVVWNKIASIHGAIVWKNMSGTKYPLKNSSIPHEILSF